MNTSYNPSLSKLIIEENFWLNDPVELYKNNNYHKIIPKKNMSQNEKFNAITRCCFFIIILILILNINLIWLLIPIFIIIIILFKFYFFNNKDTELFKNLEFNLPDTASSGFISLDELNSDEYVALQEGIESDCRRRPEQLPYKKLLKYKDNNQMIHKPAKDNLEYYKKCRMPTINNPFMNPFITDFRKENIPSACNADDENIIDDIKVNFNYNLFRNVDELWEKANSQRQFYTLSNTSIPNHQKEFAEWLYKIPDSYDPKFENLNHRIRF